MVQGLCDPSIMESPISIQNTKLLHVFSHLVEDRMCRNIVLGNCLAVAARQSKNVIGDHRKRYWELRKRYWEPLALYYSFRRSWATIAFAGLQHFAEVPHFADIEKSGPVQKTNGAWEF